MAREELLTGIEDGRTIFEPKERRCVSVPFPDAWIAAGSRVDGTP